MATTSYENAPIGSVLDYVVKDENTLGYLYKGPCGTLMIGVLAGSVLRGGANPVDGPVFVSSMGDIRLATEEDFSNFRVCSCGHIS